MQCLEFGVKVAAGFLLTHLQIQHGLRYGVQGGGTPPRGGPDLSGRLPKSSITTLVTGGWVSGVGDKMDQTLGSLCELPRVGHNCDPVDGETTLPQMPQM